MVLGFNFTLKEECKMEIAKVLSLRFMSHYGKGKKPDSGYFSNRLVKKIAVEKKLAWKAIGGIDGYKFCVDNGELKCINAQTYAVVSERIKDGNWGYFSFYNQSKTKGTRSLSTLKLAYCFKYGLSVDDSEVRTKRFGGTVDDPKIKG